MHHIVPRCLRGPDVEDNLVRLTPEEHYIAHQLLAKMHPNNGRLIQAANMMTAGRASNKTYGWIRRRLSKEMKENNPNRNGAGRRKYLQSNPAPSGWKLSDETKAQLREQKLGNKNPNKDGRARLTRTYLIDAATNKLTFEFSSLKEAEATMSKVINDVVNHASIHYNRKRNRPYKGYYWCVGEIEYENRRK